MKIKSCKWPAKQGVKPAIKPRALWTPIPGAPKPYEETTPKPKASK